MMISLLYHIGKISLIYIVKVYTPKLLSSITLLLHYGRYLALPLHLVEPD